MVPQNERRRKTHRVRPVFGRKLGQRWSFLGQVWTPRAWARTKPFKIVQKPFGPLNDHPHSKGWCSLVCKGLGHWGPTVSQACVRVHHLSLWKTQIHPQPCQCVQMLCFRVCRMAKFLANMSILSSKLVLFAASQHNAHPHVNVNRAKDPLSKPRWPFPKAPNKNCLLQLCFPVWWFFFTPGPCHANSVSHQKSHSSAPASASTRSTGLDDLKHYDPGSPVKTPAWMVHEVFGQISAMDISPGIA